MRFAFSTIALVALLGEAALAAPIYARQGAGVGAGCDSIVSDADTMLGDASRGTGENIAGALSGNGGGMLRRQGAGVGAGCNSIVSDADTMLGDASRGVGESIASSIKNSERRQLNGIADGVTAITGTVPGLGDASDQADTFLNNVDGYGTQGSAELGQEVGDEEVQLGHEIGGTKGYQTGGGGGGGNGGSAPPPPPPPPGHKRQLNGIADGVTAVTGVVPGAGALSNNMDGFLNTVDGQGTSDSAEVGAIVGDEEVQLGKEVGGPKGYAHGQS